MTNEVITAMVTVMLMNIAAPTLSAVSIIEKRYTVPSAPPIQPHQGTASIVAALGKRWPDDTAAASDATKPTPNTAATDQAGDSRILCSVELLPACTVFSIPATAISAINTQFMQ